MLLEGKVVLVSGVGPGTGRDIALLSARDGADVVVAARTQSTLDQVAAEVRAQGRRALAVATDVTKPEECQAAVEAAVAELGRLDVLVCNQATEGRRLPVDEIESKRFRLPFEVNLFGSLNLCQAAVPHMKRQGGGAIVMVNTLSMRRPTHGASAYAASKAALHSLVRSLALELGVYNIRANSVMPSWIWAPNVQRFFEQAAAERGVDPQQLYEETADETALKRLSTSADVAEAVIFLASDRARAITGQSLDVNAGSYFT